MSTDSSVGVFNPLALENAELMERALKRGIAQLTALDKWMIVVGVSLATCIELGTGVAVNVILVDMKGNVAASQDEVSWVIIVYSAAFFSVLPLTDWLSRRVGYRDHLVMSLLLYASGALGCFLSHSLWELLVARAVMGIGGGAFLVRALIALYRLYEPQERRLALLTFFGFVMCSRALLPVLFAAVTDHGTWNLAFLVLAPLALLPAVVLYFFLPHHLEFPADAPPADPVGTALIVTGLIAFQVVMSRGEQDMWLESGLIRFMAILCIACLGTFVWWDFRPGNASPVVNLRVLLAERELASGMGLALILGILLAAGLYVLPQYLRGVEGYSATQAAWFFCVDGFATLGGSVLALNLMPKIVPRVVVLAGLGVNVLTNLLLIYALTTETPALDLCAILMLHGLSLGMLLPGTMNLLVGHARFRDIAFAMTIYFSFRQLGGALGVAAITALTDIRETFHSSRLLDTANRLNPAAQGVVRHLGLLLRTKGLPTSIARGGSYAIFQGLVVKQSMLLTFMDVFWILALLAVAGVIVVVVFSSGRTRKAVSLPYVC